MGGRRSVAWTEEARPALSDAIEYVAQDSVEAAIRILEEADRVADSLAGVSSWRARFSTMGGKPVIKVPAAEKQAANHD